MPRPELHSKDSILDAARRVVLEQGLGAATVATIAESSGAPVGSIYHRFGSVDYLLAEMWIRAVRRSQEGFAAAATAKDDPTEAAVGAALALYDFCLENPADARLLMSFRPTDLARGRVDPDQRAKLQRLNDPVVAVVNGLARHLYGRASKRAMERVILAVVDLPFGAVRRPLVAGEKLTPTRREGLEQAVRAVLAGPR